MRLTNMALVVRDYDEAIDYFTRVLGFSLVEDTPLPGKRWVRVKPPGGDMCLLLARAKNTAEESRIGNQTGGRVFMDTTHWDPTGTWMPRASSTSPVNRVKVPRTSSVLSCATL